MPTKTAALLRDEEASAEDKAAAAAALGSSRSPRKAAASRANGFQPGSTIAGRKRQPIEQIECRCGAGTVLEGHRWDCPRGQAIKRRMKAGEL